MKIALVSLLMIGAAYATGASAAGPVSATLRQPLPKHMDFVRGETAWTCSASQCNATVTDSDTDSWESCKTLVRTVGPVATYGSLDAKGVARCNGETASK